MENVNPLISKIEKASGENQERRIKQNLKTRWEKNSGVILKRRDIFLIKFEGKSCYNEDKQTTVAHT